MAKKRIEIEIGAKNKVTSALKSAEKNFKAFGRSVRKILRRVSIGVAATTASVFGLAAMFLKAGSDAEETRTKFEAVFSSIRDEAEATADALARDFGLAGTTARKLLGDTGDLLVGFGFAEKAALGLADEVNRLAIDLASFTNYSGGAVGASQALTKMLLGETEQAKSLGISIKQGTKEFNKAVAAQIKATGATELQAKAMAMLEIALSQTKKAQGDYARTSDGFANTMRRLSESWRSFREEIGLALNRSGAFTRLLETAKTKLESMRDSIVGIIDALSREDGRREIGAAISRVVISAFRVGAEKVANVLKMAAPEIGHLIGRAIEMVTTEAAGRRSVAEEMVTKKWLQSGRFGELASWDRSKRRAARREYTSDVDAQVSELEKLDLLGLSSGLNLDGLTRAEAGLAVALEDLDNTIKKYAPTTIIPPVTKPTIRTGESSTGIAGLQDSTSMIGIGELFTMMQTGRARQTEVEIMQKQQNTLEEIRDAIKEGGLE